MLVSSLVIPASTKGAMLFFFGIVFSAILGRQHRKSIESFFFSGLLSKFNPPARSWNSKRSWTVSASPTVVSFHDVVRVCRTFKRRNTGDRSQGCCVPIDDAKCLFRIMHSALSSSSCASNSIFWIWGLSPSNKDIDVVHLVIGWLGFHPNISQIYRRKGRRTSSL